MTVELALCQLVGDWWACEVRSVETDLHLDLPVHTQ